MDVAIPEVNKFNPPNRLLCGPGPGNAHPRVLSKMSLPQVGHLDPYFLELMEDIKALLRYAYQTKNDFTIPVSGTGSAAMEACVCNMIEPGDTMLIGVNGYFGKRLVDMAGRYGAKVSAAPLACPGAASHHVSLLPMLSCLRAAAGHVHISPYLIPFVWRGDR